MTGQLNSPGARGFALLLCPALGLLISVSAAEIPAPERAPVAIQEGAPATPPTPAPLVLKLNDASDASRIAYELARSFLDEAQWKSRVAAVRRKFADWEKDNTGDIGSYLNYQIPAMAFSVASGKAERLKEGAVFVALYREFGQPVPQVVTHFARENLASLNVLFASYTWEKGSDYVKTRQWQKDRAAEKQKSETEQK